MACQGWRLSAAVQSAKKRRCGCGHQCEHWSQLRSYLIGLSSDDQERKIDTLKSLAALLLCLASGDTAPSTSHDYAVSVRVEETWVSITHEDVILLYKALFQELANISSYLDIPSCNQGIPSDVFNTEAHAQTLCCCVRILRIIDMFNTSVGHSASLEINGMLHQLCAPAKFLERQHAVLRSSLLEVFLEEILLQQDLACLFLTEGGGYSETDIHSQASIEAAFAHMLYDNFLKYRKPVSELQVCKLSLPAGVLLLDMSTGLDFTIPSGFLAHIISLVAKALLPSSECTLVEFSKGSILERLRIEAYNPQDELPHGIAIGLASSVVETSMGLLSRYYSTSLPLTLRDSEEYTGGNDDRKCLVAALLRTMAYALFRIAREVSLIKCRSSNDSILCTSDLGGLAIKSLDSVAAAISFNMPSMRFMQTIGCIHQEMIQALTSGNALGVIGWTLVIFSHILWYESQRGLDEFLTIEYIRVLDSLMGLLLLCRLLEGDERSVLLDSPTYARKDSGMDSASDPANFFLQQMTKLLQRTAWDMSFRKKSNSHLVSFISRVLPIQRNRPSEDSENISYEEVEEIHMEEGSDLNIPLKPRASTLAIARRFKLKMKQIKQSKPEETVECTNERKRTRSISSSEAASAKVTRGFSSSVDKEENSYISAMLARDKYEESFEDLGDFIVCKEGRSYTKFLNRRIKYRRRNHTKLIWKRREEKRNILRLLDLADDNMLF